MSQTIFHRDDVNSMRSRIQVFYLLMRLGMSHLTSIVFECFFFVSVPEYSFFCIQSHGVGIRMYLCIFLIHDIGKCAMVYKHSTVMWFIVYSKVILFFVLITSQYCEYDQCFFLFFSSSSHTYPLFHTQSSLHLAHSSYFFLLILYVSLSLYITFIPSMFIWI